MRDIGKNIRKLRTEKGLTQDQLAEMLFVTRQTVSNYETGKSRPDIDMLMKIAEVLDADINAVLYGPAPKPDRKRELMRLAVFGSAAIILGVPLIFLRHWALDDRLLRYNLEPIYWLYILYVPVYYPFLGWTLMEGQGFWLKAKPLRHPIVPHIRRGILLLFVLYLIVMLPLQFINSCHFITFAPPRAWQRLGFWIIVLLAEYPAALIPLGAALWLCGFPAKKVT